MGVEFLDHLGGKLTYSCSTCGAHLTNREQRMSTKFYSKTGWVYLFDKVVNVLHGETEFRRFLTGKHAVRDAFCKRCGTCVGWFYEFIKEDTERFKEGKTVLERKKISVVKEKIDF